MKKIEVRKNSILVRLLVPLLLVTTLQIALFAGAVFGSGAVRKLDSSSFAILNERVANRMNYLQSDMVNRWSNVSETVEAVNAAAEEYAENGGNLSLLESDEARSIEFLMTGVREDIVGLLRRNVVNGAFVVFGNTHEEDEAWYGKRYGFYVRDLDPTSNPAGRSDLLLEVFPGNANHGLNIAISSTWNNYFSFGWEADFFNKPLTAAKRYPGTDIENLGYWSKPYSLTSPDISVVTYTVPLRVGEELYGVLGVEVTVDYLKRALPFSEISDDNGGSYVLAVQDAEEPVFSTVCATGALYTALYPGQDGFRLGDKTTYDGNDFYGLSSDRVDAYCSVHYLRLYNSNTPFESQRWALVGMLGGDALYRFSRNVQFSLLLAVVGAVVGSIIILVLATVFLTRPLRKTVNQLNQNGDFSALAPVGIHEVDELIDSIRKLSGKVVDSSARLSKIIDATGLPIGAYEYAPEDERVFVTDKFFSVIGRPDLSGKEIGVFEFKRLMAKLEENLEQVMDGDRLRVYSFSAANGLPHWVQMRVIENAAGGVLGVAQDVTRETIEKHKIEHERDYDLLTNLLNRRAFRRELSELFKAPEKLGIAAFMMIDLDNLKHINDTYGHDCGDEYLQLAATALKRSAPENSLVARMAGDEFYVFLYGYVNREDAQTDIEKLRGEIKDSTLILPDSSGIRLRATGGIAWYPEHSSSMEELIQFADFAMYEVKHTVKGKFQDFSPEHYSRESYLLFNKEDLNKLIEDELVEYHFQPIVDVTNGTVLGYEALMRSLVPSLKNPTEILQLARSQSKLGEIERLTWFKALAAYAENAELMAGRKIFINSISSQLMSDAEIEELKELYRPYLDRIVMEFTEDERQNEAYTHKKQYLINSWGGKIALDDFGSGYNGENFLLTLSPDYIKIDMAIVRNVHSDLNRQQLIKNIANYAHERGIKVIAEGAESKEEVAALMQCGVDYLQGFYAGAPRPKPQLPAWSIRREIVSLYNACKRAGRP